MKNKKLEKFMAKQAMPLILGGLVVVAGATGIYFYADRQGNKLSTTDNQTDQNQTTDQSQTNGDNLDATLETPTTTTTPTDTATASATLGDVSFQIIKNPDAPTTASVSLYGPAGTYGVEKLVNGSWVTVTAKFSYSGSGGYVFDTMNSSTVETHYRVFALNGATRTATSGDTIINWSLVNENGIYTISVAR